MPRAGARLPQSGTCTFFCAPALVFPPAVFLLLSLRPSRPEAFRPTGLTQPYISLRSRRSWFCKFSLPIPLQRRHLGLASSGTAILGCALGLPFSLALYWPAFRLPRSSRAASNGRFFSLCLLFRGSELQLRQKISPRRGLQPLSTPSIPSFLGSAVILGLPPVAQPFLAVLLGCPFPWGCNGQPSGWFSSHFRHPERSEGSLFRFFLVLWPIFRSASVPSAVPNVRFASLMNLVTATFIWPSFRSPSAVGAPQAKPSAQALGTWRITMFSAAGATHVPHLCPKRVSCRLQHQRSAQSNRGRISVQNVGVRSRCLPEARNSCS